MLKNRGKIMHDKCDWCDELLNIVLFVNESVIPEHLALNSETWNVALILFKILKSVLDGKNLYPSPGIPSFCFLFVLQNSCNSSILFLCKGFFWFSITSIYFVNMFFLFSIHFWLISSLLICMVYFDAHNLSVIHRLRLTHVLW